ncbi:MAG: hypothetical protein L6V80_01225 [Bacteroidales bacterium]|nr:MAG: hypothetical protein L6V80_01225 [Bacteroidales bacterium]
MLSTRRILTAVAATVAALLAAQNASAQYYSWGADPARFRWMRDADSVADVIYPRHAAAIGAATGYFVRRIQPYISYGYRLPALDLPFIVHPENMRSNGLVMWLPKRVEFLSAPAVDGYSMPWIKQLVAHEYRHAVQYNNLNVGVVKAVSYLLGQQSSTIGLLFMPLWMIEGDATMSETEASSFGRALQPRFTLEFRAMGDIATKYRNIDKFLCGSYRDFIPDHYQLGYQMVARGNEIAGRVFCDDIAAYGPRHPWMVVSTGLTMKKLFGFTTLDLFRSTFRTLTDYWDSLPAVEPTTKLLPAPAVTSYTTYSDPVWIDGRRLLLIKEDLDRTSHFVTLDTRTGVEHDICYTGDISTRPAYDTSTHRLWWTEYRRSKMFDEKVDSRICYLDLDTLRRGSPRPRTLRGAQAPRGNILYPTPDGMGGLAWVRYRPDGIYTIHYRTADGRERECAMPFGEEIHSLAWDNATQRLYYIATGNEGMWIGSIDEEFAPRQITRPAYITLSNLRARDGRLYFGSIASGRDEAHCYDLAAGREYQITESRYGSFDPAPAADGRVAVTTYDSTGYHPALQYPQRFSREVAYSPLPRNLVNPPRKRWGTINLDTVRLDSTVAATAAATQSSHTRRYRKAATLFNFHRLGAPVVRSLLAERGGRHKHEPRRHGHDAEPPFVGAGILHLRLELGAGISMEGVDAVLRPWPNNQHRGHIRRTPEHISRLYLQLADTLHRVSRTAQAGAILLLRGRHIVPAHVRLRPPHTLPRGVGIVELFERPCCRHRTPAYRRGGISNVATIGYKKGLHLTAFSLGYQDMTRMAHRDFATPWGLVASATYAMNPADSRFDDLISLYAKTYTPGLMPHNSLTLEAAYQTSFGGFSSRDALSALTFNATRLLPRGFYTTQIENKHYIAASINYQLPLCYPDGGLHGIIYFKRIRANFGFDYAQFRRVYVIDNRLRERWHRINSWGGDLTFDVNLLSQPASATIAFTLSLYRPSEGGVYFSAGMALPF